MEYLKYLIPVDAIQWTFCIGIASLALGTVLWLLCTAKPANWKKNWENRTFQPDDDVDAEHGSVYELAEIVATPAEHCAATLPSTLLLIGLLGTFLGIGVAITHATEILSGTDLDISFQMSKMMGTLSPMGAKFKCSIYGILGCLLFSFFRSFLRLDDARLRWCIIECNKQIKRKRDSEKKKDSDILRGLSHLNDSIRDTLKDCFEKQQVAFNLEQEALLGEFSKQQGHFLALIEYAKNLSVNMQQLASVMGEEVSKIGLAASEMGQSSKSLSASSDSLKASVDDFTPAVMQTLGSIQNTFVASIQESSKTMERAGISIEKAVYEMAVETKDGQKILQQTLEKFDNNIRKSLSDIQAATSAIEEVSGTNKDVMQNLNNTIDGKLDAISKANLAIRIALREMPDKIVAPYDQGVQSILKMYAKQASKKDTLLGKLEKIDDTMKKCSLDMVKTMKKTAGFKA